MEDKKVQFGIDLFCKKKTAYQNVCFALVTNNAATTSNGELTRDVLLKTGFKITKLFSPEHGLTAKGPDGTFQNNTIDSCTRLPVISLYSNKLMPDEKDLADIDAVLFDVPDVGCRFYTYLWTMTYVMEACAVYNKRFILLDRPNPIGGNMDLSEGPMMDEMEIGSFTGRWNIPIRHCCTFGELTNYFSSTRIKGLDLESIKMNYWNRENVSNFPFVSPSPAITDLETALLYPGMGLLEGINVNEGRGTGTPFKVFGSPWINADELQNAFISLRIPGIKSYPISYKPSLGIYVNEVCHGLRFSLTRSQVFRPVNMSLKLIHLFLSLYPHQIIDRLYKTTVNPTGENHLDKLLGVKDSLEKIKNDKIPDTKLDNSQWKTIIRPYLFC